MLTCHSLYGYAEAAMKLWFKYAAGMLFGAALFAVSPKPLLDDGGAVASLAELSMRIGYYIFVSLLCVNLPLSVLKLYEEKKFWSIALGSLRFFLISLVAATIIGIGAALIALPVRVPLLADIASPSVSGIGHQLFVIFPQNLSELFLRAGEMSVPALIFALIVGFAMAHDPIAARPVENLLDSVSRILYTINTFITEILGVLLIPITARALHIVTSSLSGGIYASFLAIVALASLSVLFIVIPAFIFLIDGRKNPFPLLFSGLPSYLAAFGSGSLRFSSGSTIRQVRENLGVKRRYNAAVMPMGLLFGRAGTAFIAAISFVIIISSYSQLSISVPNLLLMALLIPCCTIIAGSSFMSGPIAVLTLACSLFGRGFENGYLVMVPIALLLSMIAALIDAVWIGAAHRLSTRSFEPADPKSPRHFI